MNWPSNYCRPDVDSKLMFRFFAQVSENASDQIFQRVPSTENLCALKAATTPERLTALSVGPECQPGFQRVQREPAPRVQPHADQRVHLRGRHLPEPGHSRQPRRGGSHSAWIQDELVG